VDPAVSNLCDSECLADRKRWARFLPLFCGAGVVAARPALIASWSIRLCQTKTGGSASETAEIRSTPPGIATLLTGCRNQLKNTLRIVHCRRVQLQRISVTLLELEALSRGYFRTDRRG
jgi:hypothetical protein